MDYNFSITNIIIIITCFTSYLGFTQISFFEKYKFYPYAIARDGSFVRFISSGFLHSREDFSHIIFNMMTLYSLGNGVENFFIEFLPNGSILYLALYLSGIAAASAPDYFQHQNNPSYAAIGASGGTSAVIFSFMFFQPWAGLRIFILPSIPAIIFGVLYLVYSTYMAKRGRDNIGHSAHFWGGIYGFVFTCILAYILYPELLQSFLEQMSF